MKALHILNIGTYSGTCLHRAEALRRLGHEVEFRDPRKFLPPSGLLDRWIWKTGALGVESVVRRKLLSSLDRKRFDLVLVDGGELIGPKLVRQLKQTVGPVINYNMDDPYGGRDGLRWRQYLASVPFYDLTIVLRECNIQEAKDAGAPRVLHVTMAADEVAHAPLSLSEEEWRACESDVLFVGTWMPERGPFLAKLIELGVPLSIWGHRWERAPEWPTLKAAWRGPALSDRENYAKAVQCAKVCIGLLSKGNRDQTTCRSFEIPMLGGLLCAERTPEHLQLYRENVEAVFWSTPEECATQCMNLIQDAEWRKGIAIAGRKRCIANGSTNEPIMQKILDTALSSTTPAGRPLERTYR